MRADFWMVDNLCTPGVCVTQTFCSLEKSCPNLPLDNECTGRWLQGYNHLVCQVNPGENCKAKGVSVVCTQPKKCKCKYNEYMEKVCADDSPDNGGPNWENLCS